MDMGHVVCTVVGIVVGAILGGYIVKNNKDKAFKALDELKVAAEEALEAAKKELKK